jgi:hypothetical protein
MSLAVVWFGYFCAKAPLKQGGDFVSLARKMGMGLPAVYCLYIYLLHKDAIGFLGIEILLDNYRLYKYCNAYLKLLHQLSITACLLHNSFRQQSARHPTFSQ